ncbi:MAG TPA: hypothetical protein VLL76_05210 [Candidatus Omnitrophota bacterium]|nr:hypothetical protein [Candidatus Omnitrophota bacterium]
MDLDGRELVWLAVLGCVARGPVVLGQVLAHVEHEVGHWTEAAAVSRYLHEMARGGHIVLACDGRRWMVSTGPKGGQTLARLMGLSPDPNSPSLRRAFQRLRRMVGIWRQSYAV